jgi:hypothetical protein
MAIIASKSGEGDFELVPADSYAAVCYRVLDLGTQQTEFDGVIKHAHKIMVSWELDCKMADGRPFSTHKRYTLSLHDKATLRHDLESWRGRPFTVEEEDGFDVAKLIGAPCLMQIIHNQKGGKTYANISSIMKLPKGMAAPVMVNEPINFSLDEFDAEVFNKLSESLRSTIAKSPEYAESAKPKQPINYELTEEIAF